MAASSEKKYSGTLTTHSRETKAAAMKQKLENEQRKQANENLLRIRFMTEASTDNIIDPHDAMMKGSLERAIAEDEHPNWNAYNPLLRFEHFHRYPLLPSHHTLLPMINTVFSIVASHIQSSISEKKMAASCVDVWLQDVVDMTHGTLAFSPKKWTFQILDYPSVSFAAHQLLFVDSNNVKLFIIILNDLIPYDFFFFFF